MATVVFETGDGTAPQTQSVKVGEKVQKPADPVREDYRFEGWFADAACTVLFDFDKAITENTTVYAKWIQLVATVTFSWYEGKTETVKVEIGSPVARPAQDPVREDYAFVDWYSNVACTELYDFGSAVNANKTVYAGWDLTTATIVLDHNYEGAPEGGVIKVKAGEKAQKPADPVRTGYTFAGWFADYGCTEEFDFSTPVNNNFTLYAKWDLAEYEVTFSMNYAGGQDIALRVP